MYEGGTNVVLNKPGHMMPIFSKKVQENLQTSSSQELLNLLQ